MRKSVFIKVRALLNFAGTSIDRRPLTSFFVLLGTIVLLIVIGNFLRKAPEVKVAEKVTKPVQTYGIGTSPKITLTGTVEKSGVITVVAQSPGIVQKVRVTEGSVVNKGTWLINLSSNYQGGSIASVSRQIAQANFIFAKDNYPKQKELIGKRRELAEKSDTLAADLRDIASKSIDETKSLISLNENIVNGLDSQIASLESTNVGGANDALILQTKQGKAGVLAGLTSLKGALRSTEYQVSADNQPAQLGNIGKDIALRGLELEEKALDLNLVVGSLNLKLAQVSESFMNPVSPVSGVVERVFVSAGESVNPGTPLATVKAKHTGVRVVVPVSRDIANSISRLEPCRIQIESATIDVTPTYVSTEATTGTLHTLHLVIPDEYVTKFTDNSIVSVEVPIGNRVTNAAAPYVPLDAIYQTDRGAYLYVASQSGEMVTAFNKQVQLGTVQGSYVEVLQGLGEGDLVIVTRGIVDGDTITIQ